MNKESGNRFRECTYAPWRGSSFHFLFLLCLEETLFSKQEARDLLFLPQRGNFTRGIFATAYTRYEGSLQEAQDLFENYYENHPFTQVSQKEVHLKQVINTNQCHIHLHQHQDYLLITSVLDNLLKGASGQALQNLNLIMGWEETLGLQLKATNY